MKSFDLLQKELHDAEKCIGAERIERIDFDRLADILAESRNGLESQEDLSEELLLLKEDFRQRLTGMLKANLACRFNEFEADLAVRLTDDTNGFKAAELISLYRKVSARFRDNFPNSFHIKSKASSSQDGMPDWNEYKI